MKNLIFRFLLIFIIFYISFYIYIELCPLCYDNPNNTRWYFLKEILTKKQQYVGKPQLLFLGDSRINAAIDFKKIPQAWSLATGGTTPIENYYFLKRFIELYGKPKLVILSISPRFLSEKYAFWPYAVRNDFFNFNEYKEIFSYVKKYPNDTIFSNFFWGKIILYKLHYPAYYQYDIYRNKVFFAYAKNKKFIRRMIENRGGRPIPNLKDSCSEANYETRYKNFHPSSILTAYLYKMIEVCQDSNIDFVFIAMPMNRTSERLLKPLFVKNYVNFMRKIKSHYPQFLISDTLYFYPDSLFGDPSHLNAKGKKIYTEFFRNYLKINGLLD